MCAAPVISATELAAEINNPRLRLFDCRFLLKNTEKGEQLYNNSHLPNAQYLHLDRDMSSEITENTGRHPLPDRDGFRELLMSKGVSDDSLVVVYDSNQGAIAGRCWWLARWIGLKDVRILDGGLHAWAEIEQSMSKEVPVYEPGQISVVPDAMPVTQMDEIARIAAGDSDRILVDARDNDRFAGQTEPLDPVAGHVPTAFNAPFDRNMDDEGYFLPVDTLRERFMHFVEKVDGAEKVVHMCGSGVTACNNIIAMELAGLSGSSMYPGSWSEWITDPKNPVATEID